ncbi:MAG: site-2 protease family protein [Rhodospirillales bacterium]|nr:site-2 protease family protein [Rhodospirillales bacterium]
MTGLILPFLLAAVPTIIAITLHEAAHGYAALAMGDDTARQAGRLSLNPLAHIDRFGTIILPGFLLVAQLLTIGRVGFMFGWAKPVPVSAWKFRDPRRGMMVVAAAGPAMNFLLAWIGAVLLHAVPLLRGVAETSALEFLFYFMLANIVLGVFNLIPLPPLDGGRIAVGLLPLPLARLWAQSERWGILIVLGLLFVVPALARQAGFHFDPIRSLLGAVLEPALRLVLALALHPPLGAVMLGDV